MTRTQGFMLTILAVNINLAMAEQSVKGEISAVTVYPQAASVTRTLDVTLPKGPETIFVYGLPEQADQNSFRIEGLGTKGVVVQSIELRKEVQADRILPQAQMLQTQLTEQQDQLAQLTAEDASLAVQQTYLQKLAEQGVTEKTQADLNQNLKFLGEGMKQTGQQKAKLAKLIREQKTAIDTTQRALEQLQNQSTDSQVAMIHLDSAGGKAQLQLSYQIQDAGWYPVYDANLLTDQKSVVITQGAYIRQNSGENWQNVALTLSTARPTANTEPPVLSSWWIDYQKPVVANREIAMKSKAMLADSAEAGVMMAAPVAITQQQAVVDAQGFQISYRVPNHATVLSNGEPQRFALQQHNLNAKLKLKTMPRFDPHAYLFAEMSNQSQTPWLAGEWRLQRDGVPVGQTSQGLIAPNASVGVGFGADDHLMLTWQTVKDEQHEEGVLNKQQQLQRQYNLLVENGHTTAIELEVLDSWPVSKQQEIHVEMLAGTKAPEPVDVEKQPGIQSWIMHIPAQKKATLDTGYQVTYPKDKEIDRL